MYRHGVMIILRKGDRYLIAHKTNAPPHEWYFPGGGIKQGETPEAAFFREMKEELGLDKNTVKNVNISSVIHSYEWGKDLLEKTGFKGQRQIILIADLMTDTSMINLQQTNELDDYKFVSKNELFDIIPHDDLKRVLRILFSKNEL